MRLFKWICNFGPEDKCRATGDDLLSSASEDKPTSTAIKVSWSQCLTLQQFLHSHFLCIYNLKVKHLENDLKMYTEYRNKMTGIKTQTCSFCLRATVSLEDVTWPLNSSEKICLIFIDQIRSVLEQTSKWYLE